MNMLVLVGAAAQNGEIAGTGFLNSCALPLFLAGGILLAIAGYFLFKASKPYPILGIHGR